MSADGCLAILLDSLMPPVPTIAQTSRSKSRNRQGHDGHSESCHRALLGWFFQDTEQPDPSNRGRKINFAFSPATAGC